MSGYLIDTNIASHIVRGDRREIVARLIAIPMAQLAISSVTEGELLYGLAKRSHPPNLTERVRQFLVRVDVLAWDRQAAHAYGKLRALCEGQGVNLASLDMMIAAHAVASDRILVSRDKAFDHVPGGLVFENWMDEAF